MSCIKRLHFSRLSVVKPTIAHFCQEFSGVPSLLSFSVCSFWHNFSLLHKIWIDKYATSLHSKGLHLPQHLSLPPSFSLGILRAWSACVAAMVCALLVASLDPSSLIFRRLQLQKSTKNPSLVSWNSDTHLFVSRTCGMLFPHRQLINRLFDISELNKFSSLSVFSLTDTAVYVHNIWSDYLKSHLFVLCMMLPCAFVAGLC